MIFDEKGHILIGNSGAMDFFAGFSKEIRNKKIHELFAVEEGCFSFQDSKKSEEAECLLNKRYCHIAISKIFDEYRDIIGYIVVLNDLTEKRDFIQKLQISEHEAEMANHAKSNFLARMSHEIRTPINGVIGMNEMILQKSKDEQITNYAKMVKISANNLMELVNDILDISKIESGKMELVMDSYYTSQLLNAVSMIVAPQIAQKGLTFHTKIDQNIPRELYGDKVRLRSVLTNILNNAVKYTQEGNISFEVSILKQTTTHVTLEFKISDTGIGIRAENLDNLFESFERFDQKIHYGIEGTGLGLAISNGYVQLMGGEIKVERINTYSFDGEAVLMAGDGVGAGKVFHYANGKFDYHQRVYNLHNFKDVSGLFFYYYILNKFRYIIEEGAAKNTVDSVRLNMIQDFWMTIPPVSEQQNIVKYIDGEISKIDAQISKANRRIELLNELKQSVITEAVTGKIKVC